jgi:membrane protein DedA with SNARE-associated domain
MASAALAGQGYFSFFWIVVIGSLGNIIGDNIGYFLARRYGKYVFYKMGLKKSIESDRYKRIEERLVKHSGFVIFITRFEVFSNLAVNIMCGLSKLPYKKYLAFEVVGEVAQVLLYCSIGYFVGDNWVVINTIMSKSIIYTALVLLIFIFLFLNRVKNKK